MYQSIIIIRHNFLVKPNYWKTLNNQVLQGYMHMSIYNVNFDLLILLYYSMILTNWKLKKSWDINYSSWFNLPTYEHGISI